MGDPKRFRKKYATPVHPWNKARIDAEKGIVYEFGLRKKKEIMIADSFLKKYMNLAKKLIAKQTPQGEKEKEQILTKLRSLGMIGKDATLDTILGLTVQDVLNRRLQSVVCRQGLARSMKQSRQFIVHRHILVNGKEITAPGYLVSLEEEAALSFKEKSALSDAEHPERKIEKKEAPVEEKKEEVQEDEGVEVPAEDVE